LHREVVLRYHDHLGTYLLGLARCPQFHGATTLPLASGFLAAFAHRCHRLGSRSLLGFRFGWARQAGGKHNCLLFPSKSAGLCSESIVVLANDVDFLPLFLRRATA
jgi:hypothetical protein